MPDKDLAFLRAGTAALPDYLQAGELFWPLPRTSLPRLTLGGLLLSLRRAAALSSGPAQANEVARLQQAVDQERRRQRARWEGKAARELEARLRMWRNFLDDYRSTPEEYASSYAYEVRLRVMIALLQAETPPSIHTDEAIRAVDLLLQALFQPGEFIWEAPLRSVFPQDDFWYLYGRLRYGTPQEKKTL